MDWVEIIVIGIIGLILTLFTLDIFFDRRRGSHWRCIFRGHQPSDNSGSKLPHPKGFFQQTGAVFTHGIVCFRCKQKVKFMPRFNAWIAEGELNNW